MIASSHDFSGFLTASDINQALGTNSSMNPIRVLEDEPSGNINQPTEVGVRSQEQIDEPQAHSSLLEPEEVPAESAKVDEAGIEAGKEDFKSSKPQVDSVERRRIRRRQSRQWQALARKFSRLNTDQNGQGNLGTGAAGNRTEEVEPRPAGSVEPAAKRGRNSPAAKPTSTQPAGSVEPAAKHGRNSPAAKPTSTQPPGSAEPAVKAWKKQPWCAS